MPAFRTTILRLGMGLCLLSLIVSASRAEEKAALPKIPFIDEPEKNLLLSDLQGTTYNTICFRGHTVVLVFIGLECPVANAYVPEVQSQITATKDQKVLWFGVHSEPGVTKDEATKHAAEYKLTMPILLDGEQKLAAMVGAKKLGQVVVIQDMQVVYRGRIDDRWAANGKRRDQPGTHELQDALAAIAKKQPIAVSETESYGCPIPFKK
jgi:peroxiredoxin